MSTTEIETRARANGWAPKENYLRDRLGPEENWLPADKYLEKSESILPILRANNKKLADQANRTEAELQTTKAALQAATEAIEELKNFRSSVNKEKVKEQKSDIMSRLAQAKKDGDTDLEVQLTDKLTEVNAAIKEADKAPVKPAPVATDAPTLTPESKEWMANNPWFGTDQRRTGYAMGLANEWKAEGKPLGTKAFFDHCDEELAKVFDRNAERRGNPSKVDSTNNSSGDGGGNRGGSHTYADLPAEAKAACEKSAARLVGPNRAYKTKAEWQKRYVELYDWS
jgi:hypothetical protein